MVREPINLITEHLFSDLPDVKSLETLLKNRLHSLIWGPEVIP